MDRSRHLPINISVLLASLLMASCAATPLSGPGTPAPAPTTVLSATALADKGAATPIPATSAPPTEACAHFLPAAPCITYNSVAASSDGKALPWAAAGAVKIQLTSVNGGLQLAMRAPCSPFSAPVTIKGNTLTVGKIAVGAAGCVGAAGDYQSWLQEFLKRPIAMTYANGTLFWVSGPDSLSFKSE